MILSALALLLTPQTPAPALAPQPPVVVPGGPGGFDFMNIDVVNRLVFACHPKKNSFTVVRMSTGDVREVSVGLAVNGIAADPYGKKVYAAGPGNTLVQFDMNTWKQLASLPLGGPGDCVAYDSKRGVVYVDNDDGTNLWIVDAAKMQIKGQVAIKEAPEVMEFDPGRGRIFQNIKSSNTLQVIDPAKAAVVAEYTLGAVTGPHGLVLDRETGKLISVGSNGKLAILDADSGTILFQADVQKGSDQIAYDSDFKRLYIPGSQLLSAYQVTDKGITLLGTAPIPKGCHSVACDPLSHTVWVAYADSHDSYIQSFLVEK